MNNFTKNSALTIGTQGAIFVIGLITSVVIARVLGPEGKGIYALTTFLPFILLYFMNFGLGHAAVYLIAKKDYPREVIVGNNLILMLFHSLIALIVGIGMVKYFHGGLLPSVGKNYLYLSLVLIPSLLIFSIILPIQLGLQNIGRYNILQLSSPFLFLVLIPVLLFYTGDKIIGTLTAYIIAVTVIGLIIVFSVIRVCGRPVFKINKDYIAKVYTYGIKFNISSILLFLNQRVNVVIINWFMNPAMVGLFTLSTGLAEKIWLVADGISTVLFPKLSSLNEDTKRNNFTSLVFKTTVLVVSMICFILFLLGKLIIVLLFSDSFLGSVEPFRILLIGVIASSGLRIIESDFKGRGRPELVSMIMLISFIIMIIGSLTLIPIFQLLGAAYAMVAANICALIFAIVMYVKVSSTKVRELLIPRKNDFTTLTTALIKSLKDK
ncbi:MAG: oligosaccharide flippase family protein [Bacteroidetes bacterium]|nr:oligosaccharide flippase family protein [Bacteroidota bacterium]